MSSTFSNIFRLVDDLCTFNDEFEITYTDIYPDELGLQKVYEDTCKDSFLDISLDVIDRAFTSKLIDNTYVFPVYINHKHYLDSSILSKIFYTSVISEILCTTNLINMVTHVNPLLLLMKKRNSEFTTSFH